MEKDSPRRGCKVKVVADKPPEHGINFELKHLDTNEMTTFMLTMGP